MNQTLPSMLDMCRVIEAHIVALGQAVDVAALAYGHYLLEADRNRLDEWSQELDKWQDAARDLVCTYTPVVSAPEQTVKPTAE